MSARRGECLHEPPRLSTIGAEVDYSSSPLAGGGGWRVYSPHPTAPYMRLYSLQPALPPPPPQPPASRLAFRIAVNADRFAPFAQLRTIARRRSDFLMDFPHLRPLDRSPAPTCDRSRVPIRNRPDWPTPARGCPGGVTAVRRPHPPASEDTSPVAQAIRPAEMVW